MPNLSIQGKKYICKQCEHLETVEYKDGLQPVALSEDEYRSMSALQSQFGETGYAYEVDAVCESCFNAMLRDSESFQEELALSEQEQDKIIALQISREVLDREYWEQIGQTLLIDISSANLDSFKKANVRLFREHLEMSNDDLQAKIANYWHSLDHEKLLANWITVQRNDFAPHHMLWNSGCQALENAMQSCFNKLEDKSVVLMLDFKSNDTFGADHKFVRAPRDDQKEGCFYYLSNAQSYVMQQYEELVQDTVRGRAFAKVMESWCGRLEELLAV